MGQTMKRTLMLLIAFSLVLTSCSLFTVNSDDISGNEESLSSSNSSIETVYIEGIGEISGTVEVLVDTRQNSLESRQQELINNYSHTNCNIIKLTLMERKTTDGNTPSFIFESDDGRTFYLSLDNHPSINPFYNGYERLFLGNAYGTTMYNFSDIGNVNYFYYYGELPEDGNLDNGNIKSVISESAQYWDMELYTNTEYVELMENDLYSVIHRQENQAILGCDEAIFLLLETEYAYGLEGVEQGSVIRKLIVSDTEWYYLIDDKCIIVKQPITIAAVEVENIFYLEYRFFVILSASPQETVEYIIGADGNIQVW